MNTKTYILGAALAAALSAPAHAAVIVNDGFESGDLTGWLASDLDFVDVVTGSEDVTATTPFGPTGGDYFAELTAGESDGEYTKLSQAFTLSVASRVSFDAAFLSFDYTPYDDNAYVRIFSASTNELIFSSSVAAVENTGGYTPWTRFVSSQLSAGAYVLEAGVTNGAGPDPTYYPEGSSKLLIDSVAVAVPEPATWAMMILGFMGVGAALRRRALGAAAA